MWYKEEIVSIPYSTIKIGSDGQAYKGYSVSIPYSTIKIVYFLWNPVIFPRFNSL